MCLEQRNRQWGDKRIDLAERNDLNNVQLTNCARFINSEEKVQLLLARKSLLISEFKKKSLITQGPQQALSRRQLNWKNNGDQMSKVDF